MTSLARCVNLLWFPHLVRAYPQARCTRLREDSEPTLLTTWECIAVSTSAPARRAQPTQASVYMTLDRALSPAAAAIHRSPTPADTPAARTSTSSAPTMTKLKSRPFASGGTTILDRRNITRSSLSDFDGPYVSTQPEHARYPTRAHNARHTYAHLRDPGRSEKNSAAASCETETAASATARRRPR